MESDGWMEDRSKRKEREEREKERKTVKGKYSPLK